jgi:L-gulonolactone oxidase
VNVIAYRPFGRDPPRFAEYFARFERLMWALGGRPHWAKSLLAVRPQQLRALYPRFDDFAKVCVRIVFSFPAHIFS